MVLPTIRLMEFCRVIFGFLLEFSLRSLSKHYTAKYTTKPCLRLNVNSTGVFTSSSSVLTYELVHMNSLIFTSCIKWMMVNHYSMGNERACRIRRWAWGWQERKNNWLEQRQYWIYKQQIICLHPYLVSISSGTVFLYLICVFSCTHYLFPFCRFYICPASSPHYLPRSLPRFVFLSLFSFIAALPIFSLLLHCLPLFSLFFLLSAFPTSYHT